MKKEEYMKLKDRLAIADEYRENISKLKGHISSINKNMHGAIFGINTIEIRDNNSVLITSLNKQFLGYEFMENIVNKIIEELNKKIKEEENFDAI